MLVTEGTTMWRIRSTSQSDKIQTTESLIEENNSSYNTTGFSGVSKYMEMHEKNH